MDTIKQFLDTLTKLFGHRLRAAIERRGFSVEAFSREMGVSRATLYNWFERDDPPPSKKYKSEMLRILREPEAYLFRGLTESSTKTGHLKSGGKSHRLGEGTQDTFGAVASRFPLRREPSTRADCEEYIRQYLDAADASGDADNFPAVMRALKKHFPLDEWDEKPE